MRILITGVAGLIGSHLAKWLLANTDAIVSGIDDMSCGLIQNIPKDIHCFYKVRIGRDDLGPIFAKEKPDIVYHFVAYAAEGLSPFIRCFNYRANLLATAEIVNHCINAGVGRLVFTSSMAVYGIGSKMTGPPFDENLVPAPIDPYGIAKYASEMDIRAAGHQHDLDWCILRPHNVYGPGQCYSQRYRNVMAIWMQRYREGLPLLIYGSGAQRRAFSYVEDCLPAIYRAGVSAAASRQVINIGGRQDVSIERLCELVRGVLPGSTVKHVDGRHEVTNAWCTTEKSERLLGYEEMTPLPVGIRRMWRWLREQPFSEANTPDLEITHGLYSFWRDSSPSMAS